MESSPALSEVWYMLSGVVATSANGDVHARSQMFVRWWRHAGDILF
jgi:hypothetical protein